MPMDAGLARRSFNDNGESNGETVTGTPSQGGSKAIKTNIATQLATHRENGLARIWMELGTFAKK